MDHPGYGGTQFGGWVTAQIYTGIGFTTARLAAIRHGLWWFHGLLAIAFVASIPYTKAAHMIASYVSLSLRDPLAGKRLAPIAPERAGEPAGYGALADFSERHLIQLDACTKCGRCHEACPANATGRPLSPRDVILELREQANRAMARRRRRRRAGRAAAPRQRERQAGFALPVIGPDGGPRRDRLGVHAVQRLRRDLPGRDRAGADHQPAAAAARRGGRHRPDAAGDAADDPQVGQLVRREPPQARALDRAARLRGQGRPQGAGRGALVRRRLRLVRPALAARLVLARAASSMPRASTSGSSTTASATPATTSAESARRGCSSRSPSTTSRRCRAASSSAS